MTEKYRSESQQRILSVMLALAGNEIEGIEPSSLAKGLNVSASAITRDLANLHIAGLAERLENGNWKLSPKLVQISVAFADNLARHRHRLDEVQNRYTRQPR